ncbi:MAG: phosphatidylglycerophosphate synthase, partial [Lachnospiraceae bacterium]|nr:phosphatidylglycerophosphate synthase [Lachnospiraceae bacterium]
LPILDIKIWMFIWIGIIAIIKVINIVSGIIVRGKLISIHSAMNKFTGVLLFVLPLTITIIDLRYSAVIVCAAATFAAIQEGHYIRTGRYGY